MQILARVQRVMKYYIIILLVGVVPCSLLMYKTNLPVKCIYLVGSEFHVTLYRYLKLIN